MPGWPMENIHRQLACMNFGAILVLNRAGGVTFYSPNATQSIFSRISQSSSPSDLDWSGLEAKVTKALQKKIY